MKRSKPLNSLAYSIVCVLTSMHVFVSKNAYNTVCVRVRCCCPAAELARAPDGGILVGGNLESVSTPGVFAAGDCCT